MPPIRLLVNGERHEFDTSPGRPLLDVLREDLDLTGAKYGCGEGLCGACTVLVDGAPVRSCRTAVGDVGGAPVRTVEDLAGGDALHPVQQAFLAAGAMQCGYCTPGMVMSAVGLLAREAEPSRQAIVRGLQGNVCRCGTYRRIVRAVEAAARNGGGGR